MMTTKTPSQVIDAVCAFYKVSRAQINSASQTREISAVRQELMCLLRERTDLSLKRIGQTVGGRDARTVIDSVARIASRSLADRDYADQVEKLRRFVDAYDPAPSGVGAIDRARRCMSSASAEFNAEVRDLGMTVLMTASVLASPDLTDAEARSAALQILNRGKRNDAAA